MDAPAVVERGGTLSLVIESATGLTPPPGLQEERAHRAFAVTLCAIGISFGAQERVCFPLLVRNVRPLDGVSLLYRVDVPVPSWVAPSTYDLAVRFPGGQADVPAGLRVPAVVVQQAVGSWQGDKLIIASSGSKRVLRVHVGPRGLQRSELRSVVFPLPAGSAGFSHGYVALLELPADRSIALTSGNGNKPAFAIADQEALSGQRVRLRAGPRGAGASVFWWLGGDRGAEGATIQTTLAARGVAHLEALLITAEGDVRRAERDLPVRARHGGSCSLHPSSGQPTPSFAALWIGTGLLVGRLSRKLRARRGQAAPRGLE